MPDKEALSMAEPQVRVAPALSATSDMPDVRLAPPPVSAEVNTNAPAAEEALIETPPEKPEGIEAKEEGGKPEGEDGDQTPAWLKARITREANKRREAETARGIAEKRADELSGSLKKALEGIETLTKTQAAQITKDADIRDPRPARETFETPDAYDSALIDWAGRRAALIATAEAQKAVEAQDAQRQSEESRKRTEEANTATMDAFKRRAEKFAFDHPDYEEVTNRDDIQLSPAMTQFLLNDEQGAEVAYYLGKNPDEAERVLKIENPVRQVAEMGRIAVRVTAKTVVQPKPAPIKALKTGSEAAAAKAPNEMSMDEYGALRQRQILAEKRTRMGLPN